MSPSPDPIAADVVDEAFERWLPGAMFPSELLWLERMIRRAGVEVVIECGRQDGVSTWTLAQLLRGTGVRILSIDFDEDVERLRHTEALLDGLPVTCVSGDIHVEVPRLVAAHRGDAVAVVQDGPKGWEGMATLLAAAYEPNVALVAQHNLHLGHRTRTAFQMLSMHPCFVESAAFDPFLAGIRERETVELARRAPNRPVDHTSLGVIALDGPARAHLVAGVALLRPRLWPWDPETVRRHWAQGDFDYCGRVRARTRFTATRFKRR